MRSLIGRTALFNNNIIMKIIRTISLAAATLAVACLTACSGKTKPGNPAEELMQDNKDFQKAEATMEAVDQAQGKPIELGENDILEFDGVIPIPVVVDFSASWCGPCKQMHPIFDKLARKYHGKVRFIYVDVDKAPQLAKQYGIEAVPTLLFVDTKGQINRQIGALSEEALEGAVEAIITSSSTEPGNQPR